MCRCPPTPIFPCRSYYLLLSVTEFITHQHPCPLYSFLLFVDYDIVHGVHFELFIGLEGFILWHELKQKQMPGIKYGCCLFVLLLFNYEFTYSFILDYWYEGFILWDALKKKDSKKEAISSHIHLPVPVFSLSLSPSLLWLHVIIVVVIFNYICYCIHVSSSSSYNCCQIVAVTVKVITISSSSSSSFTVSL